MQIPRKNNVKNDNEQKVNASCESPENESRVSTSSETEYEIDAKELKNKVSFSKLLECDGKELIATAHAFKCMCPFCKDTEDKFYLWSNDSGGTCYGCGRKGDIYAYLMEKHDVGFRDATHILDHLSKDILRGEEGEGHGDD